MVPRDIEGVCCAVEEWNSGGMEACRTQLYLLPLGWAGIHILESMIAKHTENTQNIHSKQTHTHTHTSRNTRIHSIFELIEHKKYPFQRDTNLIT